MEQADTLAVYSQIIHTGKTQHTAYFFSQSLTGQVQQLSKKRLKQTYATNARFLELLRTVKWYQSLTSYESLAGGPRSFRLVALYRESVGLPAKYPH